MSSNIRAAEADDIGEEEDDHFQKQYRMMTTRNRGGGGVSEIEEEESSELFEINSNSGVPSDTIREEIDQGSLFSFDFHNGDDDAVYVAIGNKSSEESSSMDALLWTLSNAVKSPSTVVFLILVVPEIKSISTPLGMMPVTQANPKQKDSYIAQERGKRREFLQKFLNVCTTYKVKVDTILIESDMEAKAILDLIAILNVRRLVLGTTKTNLRRRTRRGSGIADKIVRGAPEFCEVKIICEGKESVDLITDSPLSTGLR